MASVGSERIWNWVLAILLVVVATYNNYKHGLVVDNYMVRGHFRIACGATRIPPLCQNTFSVTMTTAGSTRHWFTIDSVKTLGTGFTFCIYMLLMQAGDVSTNPGPVKFPCGDCGKGVHWKHRAVCCDECEVWYHKGCLAMSTAVYDTLHSSNVIWICCQCGIPNFDSSFFQSFELKTANSFAPLDQSYASTSSPSSITSPVAASTPKRGKGNRTPGTKKASKKNWRTMVINCCSVKGKIPEFHSVVDYISPDAILGTESWLDPGINNAEIFPPDYTVYRKDRSSTQVGGGVFVAIKNTYIATECKDLDAECELIWAKVQVTGSKDLYLGSYYRPPDGKAAPIAQLETSLGKLSHAGNNRHVLLGGDFNLPGIDWEQDKSTPGTSFPRLSKELIRITTDSSLTQLNHTPTRGNNVLDLLFSSHPSLMKSSHVAPGISDHDILVTDTDLKAQTKRSRPRKIHLFKKVDLPGLQLHIEQGASEFLSKNATQHVSVNTNWEFFKNIILTGIDKFIPHKMSRTNHSLPWITTPIRRGIRKRQRLYNKAKKTNSTTDWAAYKHQKHLTQKSIRQSHTSYVSNLLEESLQTKNNKPFWRYIKSKKQDTVGIASLKKNGQLHTDSK